MHFYFIQLLKIVKMEFTFCATIGKFRIVRHVYNLSFVIISKKKVYSKIHVQMHNNRSNTLLCLSGVSSEDSSGNGILSGKMEYQKTDLFQLQKAQYLLSCLANLDLVYHRFMYYEYVGRPSQLCHLRFFMAVGGAKECFWCVLHDSAL